MIDRDHDLAVTLQARLLNISRGTIYCQSQQCSPEDRKLMRRIDGLHLDYPFARSRMLRDMLHSESLVAGRRHVRTLMHRMSVEALKRCTANPTPARRTPATKSIPTCCGTCKLTVPIKSGPWTSPTSPWPRAGSI